MRKGLLRSVALLLTGSSLAVAQAPPSRLPTDGTEPAPFPAETLQVPGSGAKATTDARQPETPAEKIATPAPTKVEGKEAMGRGGPDTGDRVCPPVCDPCLPLCCDICGPPGKCWVSVEYLLWWTRTAQTPVLLTTSPDSSLGVLGQPGTRALIGGRGLDRDPYHGARITAGTWLDCRQTKGIEFSYFFLANRTFQASGGGPGTPGSATTARPFFNVVLGREDSQLVSFPNVLAGVATVDSSSRLQGITPNIICNLCCCSPTDCCNPRGYRVDLLVGPRYYHLEEDLNIREDLLVAPSVPVLGGSRINIIDSFDTENRFYGGFVGARAEFWRDRWFLNAQGGVALGRNHQEVRISGNTIIVPPTGATVNRTGGLLTQQTNIGRYSRHEFSGVPELGFNVGYQMTHTLRAFAGYNLIWWSDVVRPGDQIDRGINTTQLPTLGGPGALTGPRRPAFSFQESDFWAQGLSFGIQLRY